MTDNEKTFPYGNRKMTYVGELQPSNPIQIGDITYAEAVEKKLLQPGMTVRFEEKNSVSVKLTHEMTGEEEMSMSFRLKDGILCQNEEGLFEVVTHLEVRGNAYLKFKGRFARANFSSTIRHILESVLNLKANVYNISKLQKDCEASELFAEYMLLSNIQYKSLYVTGNNYCYCDETFRQFTFAFYPDGDSRKFKSLAISISITDAQISLKENILHSTHGKFNVASQPFDKHIYIAGVLK